MSWYSEVAAAWAQAILSALAVLAGFAGILFQKHLEARSARENEQRLAILAVELVDAATKQLAVCFNDLKERQMEHLAMPGRAIIVLRGDSLQILDDQIKSLPFHELSPSKFAVLFVSVRALISRAQYELERGFYELSVARSAAGALGRLEECLQKAAASGVEMRTIRNLPAQEVVWIGDKKPKL